MGNVTVTHSVTIAAPPERVWDYTQDYQHRATWDASVIEAEVEQEAPTRVVRVRGVGGMKFRLRYKVSARPTKTSLVMTDVGSLLFSGGGGSWVYAPDGRGTRWTQHNTLTFRSSFVGWLLGPLVRWQLLRVCIRAMRKAKGIIEELE
jgi:uncharacterized protein YndB with AHSA1/START domain